MTFADLISASAGTVLSLLMNYVPGLNTKFDAFSPNQQRGIMALMLILCSMGLAFWRCTGNEASVFTDICGDNGINWRAVLQSMFFALTANQGVDRISPKTTT